MVSIGRICGKQQSTFNNKNVSVYGKLWKRSKNGRGYMEEREGGKGSRVCGKNEEEIGESRDSIEKDIRNEEVCR